MTPGRTAFEVHALRNIYHYPADLVRMLAEPQAILECGRSLPDAHTVHTGSPIAQAVLRGVRPRLLGHGAHPIARQSHPERYGP